MPSAFPNGSQVCVIPPKESVLLPILVEILHNLKFGSILGQRIFPVGGHCVRNRVLSLQNETDPTSLRHPSGCSDRQFRSRPF